MRYPLPSAGLLAVALVGLLSQPGLANAQVLSKWGRPVVTFGWTPYDAVSTGHGNYPGSHGFIPGYGYYPGDSPSQYPWLDGPRRPYAYGPHGDAAFGGSIGSGTPDPVALEAVAGTVPSAALLRVRVPADADVWVEGQKTAQRGEWRLFVTPPLEEGRDLWYELRARWQDGATPVERTESVRVWPGDRRTIDFLRPAERHEREPASLPPPRKLGQP
jgi:uncharacterized protein (TIGR03000 family)